MGLFKGFYDHILGVDSISKKQAKEAPSMEEPELPNHDMKRLIYPDPLLQEEYNDKCRLEIKLNSTQERMRRRLEEENLNKIH